MRILKIIGIAVLVLLGIVFANNFMRGFIAGPAPAPQPTPVLSSLALLDLKASAVDVSYDELARSTEQHTGKNINLAGKVAQVIEDGTSAGLRVFVGGDVDQAVYVAYPGYSAKRVLVDDMVRMVARVDGRITYETVLGNKVTVPALTALWLAVGK
jgi:hypothetical protein